MLGALLNPLRLHVLSSAFHLTGTLCRERVHALQPEGEGPDVMMEPLRQHDPGKTQPSLDEGAAQAAPCSQ